MNRRDFLRRAGMTSAGLAVLPRPASLLARHIAADGWRTFEVTTRVEVLKPSGGTRVWLPAPLVLDTPYQRTLGNTFHADGGTAWFTENPPFGPGIVTAEWPAGAQPVLSLTSRVATRDHAVDLAAAPERTAARAANLPLRESERAGTARAARSLFLQPTSLLPTDGIVKSTATTITRSARTDVEKARAIYEWIVENTFRDPKTIGCGIGDIRFMLESGNLGGKCADLNALFVGLARAAGLPARDVYGIRVAKSERGLASLGVATENVTKAQHCRAEVFLADHGWVPVDPADVRKVVLEEPPTNLPIDHELVQRARARLFGSWEMNWVAYNFSHDVTLPRSTRGTIGYFMYPQCETGGARLDSLDPDNFKYQIVARER